MNAHDEALSILEGIYDYNAMELRAQVLYSLERYDEAADIYKELCDNSKDEDLITNYIAALVRSGNHTEVENVIAEFKTLLRKKFEFTYNAACSYLEAGNISTARDYLVSAKRICEDSLTSEGFSQQEIGDELAIIETQIAFIDQKIGNTEEALHSYENIVNNVKPSDVAVNAVSVNNLVTLRVRDEVDSLRKLNFLKNEKIMKRLVQSQKESIGFNQGLVYLHMEEIDTCRNIVNDLRKLYPENDLFPLLAAAILWNDKKFKKTEGALKKYAENFPENSMRVKLSLAQIYLSQDDVSAAIKTLEEIQELKHTPVMISTLVTLNERIGDITSAISVLEDALENISEEKPMYLSILRKCAQFLLKLERYEEASDKLKLLLSHNPKDLHTLSSLVIALSHFDAEQSHEYEERLPSVNTEVDLDTLELEGFVMPTFERKDKTKASELVEKKKTKRRNKPPKDTSRPIDEERWLPLYERSYYKGRRRNNKSNRMAQGSAPTMAPATKSNTTKPANTKPVRPTGKKKNNRRKRRGRRR
eukprot:TRINITY_DN7312_c0_g1_i1.p1 TRINITY_DN7312_c0_g1~~TRINITY_DN7312_c0_g1_i1.p1  ORF type:complete len:619 (-),score=169.14 TRINITY_DN7312_c0_g1_i1:1541-3139(-)